MTDQSRPVVDAAADPLISRVPYLAGLDGLRALAVVAVMIYHANSDWLPGGYLGVEMFFVVSGYLITLLIVAERERTYRVSLRDFWMRRARRLLPALGVLLVGVTVWTVLFERDAVGQLRGDVFAGLFYVSNWYQIWVGLGYTAAGDLAPLRHLWSLAVEEQFYLVWPLVMLVLLRRYGTRHIALASRWLVALAVAIAGLTALAFHDGPIGEPDQTPEAYWEVLGRHLSKLDVLYLGSISRASGILLGAALALVWRPYALRRSAVGRAGRRLDVLALVGLGGLTWMTLRVPLVTDAGAANPTLFQGGLLAAGVLTVFLIAAVAHPTSHANVLLDRNLLRWIGTRSYGLYLFHWPVYQAMRGVAGNKLTLREFVVAMVVTGLITEASYRLVESPVRQRRFVSSWRRWLSTRPTAQRIAPAIAIPAVALVAFSGVVLVTADVEANDIEQSFEAAEDDVIDLTALAEEGGGIELAPPTPATTVAAPTTVAATAPTTAPPPTSTPSPSTVPPSTVPPTTLEAAPGPSAAPTTAAPTTAPPTTAPVVPATTVPPTTEPPPPEPESGPRSRGIVADLNGVAPLGIDPVATDTAIPVLALGDSVMLGAAEELSARGVVVDAVVSRQFTAFLPDVQAIRDAGLIGSVVIVHLGTNGSFPTSTVDQMMSLLADVPVVVFLTGKADRGWIAGNNDIIRALPDRYGNVTVLDWNQIGGACGDCFYDDRIHLDGSGQQYYADLLGQLIGF